MVVNHSGHGFMPLLTTPSGCVRLRPCVCPESAVTLCLIVFIDFPKLYYKAENTEKSWISHERASLAWQGSWVIMRGSSDLQTALTCCQIQELEWYIKHMLQVYHPSASQAWYLEASSHHDIVFDYFPIMSLLSVLLIFCGSPCPARLAHWAEVVCWK